MRFKVLNGAGWLARRQGDLTAAQTRYAEYAALARALGDSAKLVIALINLAAVKSLTGNYAEARSLLGEALPLTKSTNNRRFEGTTLLHLGLSAYYCCDFDQAAQHLDAAMELFRPLNDGILTAMCLCNLAAVADRQGQVDKAESLGAEAYQQFATLDYQRGVLSAKVLLGRFARERGDLARAEELGAAAHAGAVAADDRIMLAQTLEELALTRRAAGSLSPAVRLLATARTLRATLPAPLPPVASADIEAALNDARAQLSSSEFQSAWDEGVHDAAS